MIQFIRHKIIPNEGMTLLEVMVAVIISAAMLTAIAALLVGAARINAISRDQRNAATLAEQKIEDMRRTSWFGLQSGSDTVGKFRREWTVEIVAGEVRIKDIKVKISWEDSKDRTHVSEFDTKIYRNAYPYR